MENLLLPDRFINQFMLAMEEDMEVATVEVTDMEVASTAKLLQLNHQRVPDYDQVDRLLRFVKTL